MRTAWFLLMLLLPPGMSVKAEEKIPVILDTDIGTDIDDAFALALVLASPELDLLGVTTVSADAFTRAMIVCRFLDAVGRSDVPVAAGRPRRDPPAWEGQYQYGLRAARKRPVPELARDFLYRQVQARPGAITLITIGDLTNVAELISLHPECKPWIKQIAIMGGSIRVGYNNQPPAEREWNIRSDVKSAQCVFQSGIPLLVAPLDATVTVRLKEPTRSRVLAAQTPLCRQIWALYALWGKETPVLFDPVAATLVFDDSQFKLERLRLEIDEKGFTREVAGEPNCRAATSVRADAYLEWYANRITAWRGILPADRPAPTRSRGWDRAVNVVQPVAPGPLPHRVHVAEDYETDIERRWWLAGRLIGEPSAGGGRACQAVPCNDFDGQMGDGSAIYKAVIFNPVPGPPMGGKTRLAFRYRLSRADTLGVQIYSLSNGYHRCLTLKNLPQDQWQSTTVDMTQARRPDGSGGPLSADERIDDIQFYVDAKADLAIDDIVLFDAGSPEEEQPFPSRVLFTGWFDTGKQGREWPGDFEIVPHQAPRTWFAARSVPRAGSDGEWIRVHLRGARPLGERVRLRFRYWQEGVGGIRVQLAAGASGKSREQELREVATNQWTTADIEFRRSQQDAPPPRTVDEVRFLTRPGTKLLVDDVLLYTPAGVD